MPYKDPEVRNAKALEYTRAYRARNRDRLNARARELRQQDPERSADIQRNYRARNADKVRERGRVQSKEQYEKNREQHLERQREYRAANRDQIRAEDRQRYRADRMRSWRMLFKHGMRPEDWAAMWAAQDGCCYLCGEALLAEKAVIDHDHSCCPPEQTCRVCRRGLACSNCNTAIGMAFDDAARLRRIADALETAQQAVQGRKAGSDEQLVFDVS